MSQLRPVAYFSLQTQFENLGDCIINEMVIRELAKHAHVKVIQSRAPTWLLNRLAAVPGVETFSSKPRWFSDLFRRLALRKPVWFAFKPGHYLNSSRLRSLAYSTALIAFCGAFRLQGGQVIRCGVSLDRFSPLQSRLQSMLGRLHTNYGVRDQASLDYARSLGVTTASYTPDMAFLLEAHMGSGPSSVSLSTNGSQQPLQAQARRNLSLSFRKQGAMQGAAQLNELTVAIQNASHEQQLKPVVVEQVTFDRELANLLADKLGCSVIRFEQSETSVRSIFQNYAASRVVVSNRLHSLLFGWTEGAIPIPVVENTPHSKIVELFKYLGIEELILYANDVHRLPEHLRSVLAGESKRREQLAAIFREQRMTLQSALADCFAKSDMLTDVRQSVGSALG
jgi:polysaccharide pyruvyl transferase WcaK-like protein